MLSKMLLAYILYDRKPVDYSVTNQSLSHKKLESPFPADKYGDVKQFIKSNYIDADQNSCH